MLRKPLGVPKFHWKFGRIATMRASGRRLTLAWRACQLISSGHSSFTPMMTFKPNEDVDSIEAASRWYIKHPGERREKGRKAREKIQDAWIYDSMFAGTLAEIEGGTS
jgi:hypothetical protein